MGHRRRRLRFETFDEMLAEVERLRTKGYQRAGNWTLGQVCEHLRMFQECSMRGFGDVGLRWWRRRVFRMYLPMLLWTGWIPAGAEAPVESQPEALSGEDGAVIEAFKRSVLEVKQFAGRFDVHPLFGVLTAEQWRRLHLVHGAHHLGFLIPEK